MLSQNIDTIKNRSSSSKSKTIKSVFLTLESWIEIRRMNRYYPTPKG